MPYNYNPSPQTYDSVYGGIPGAVGLPDPFADLSGVYPGLKDTNTTAASAISKQLGGQLSPGTINLLQDQGAQWGVASGMPGSGLARSRTARDLGLTSEGLVNQGLSNYAKLISTISGTQTVNPALQSSIAERNATINSAPNPRASQSYAQQLFNQYLQGLKGPGGGTSGYSSPAGGTGVMSGLVGGTPSMPMSPIGGGLAGQIGPPYTSSSPWDGFGSNLPSSEDYSWLGFGDGGDMSGMPYDASLMGDYGGEL